MLPTWQPHLARHSRHTLYSISAVSAHDQMLLSRVSHLAASSTIYTTSARDFRADLRSTHHHSFNALVVESPHHSWFTTDSIMGFEPRTALTLRHLAVYHICTYLTPGARPHRGSEL